MVSGRLRSQFGFGLAQHLDAVLPPSQLLGQLNSTLALVETPILQRIDQLGLAQQRRDLRLQLRLCLEHPLIANNIVLGGIGLLLRKSRRLDLGAIQRHRSKARQTRLLAQLQQLSKQTGQGIKTHPAEITDAAVIRLLVTR
jgi:hypothetical protein